MVNRFGMIAFAVTDAVFLGNYDKRELALFALANSWFIVELVFGIGIMYGNQILYAQSIGRNKYKLCGAIWRGSIVNAVMIGTLLAFFSLLSQYWFQLSGQNTNFATDAADIAIILCCGITGSLLFLGCAALLEALRTTKAILMIILLGNAINIFLNMWLINDYGAVGVAFGTLLARLTMAIIAITYLCHSQYKYKLSLHLNFMRDKLWFSQSCKALNLGKWIGFSYSTEAFAVNILYIFAAMLTISELAVFGAVMNYVSLLFVTGLGIATASSLHVGYAHGANDKYNRGLAGYSGIYLTLLWGIGFLIISVILAEYIAQIYTKFADLQDLFVEMIPLALLLVIGNCGQLTLSQIIRAIGNTRLPFMVNFICYLLICTACAWILIKWFDLGISALFYSQILACFCAMFVFLIVWLRWHPISWYKTKNYKGKSL